MNGSRVKTALAGLACGTGLTASVMVGAPAWAQGGPVILTPPERTAPLPQPPRPQAPQPAQTQPQPVQQPVQPGLESAPLPVTGAVVQSESLGQVNPDVAGAIADGEGGLGTAMWWGAERRTIDALMKVLPVTSSSPTMRDLMRRMLLTGAEVPEGGAPGTLISLRAGLLAAMGDFQGVNALLAVVPGYSANPELLRVEMDTRLLTGDVARACQIANANIETQKTVYWQKAFTFCQTMDGRGQEALLGLALLEELGANDPVFSKMADALARQGKPPVIDSLADPSPLHLAMARVAKVQLPSDVISSNRPGVLRAIAISPNASADLRLEAAERAEAAGALDVDTLRQLYASIEFSSEQLNNPLSAADKLKDPMSRALLYRATLSQTVPAAQAEALARALEKARVGGRYASTARAFLPQLSGIAASSDLAWFAPEAVRAYLVSGRPDDAQTWFTLLEDEAKRDPQMNAQLKRVMPVAKLAGFQGAESWGMDQLPGWWNAVKAEADARDKASVLVAGFDAMGEFVPDAMWASLVEGTTHEQLLAPHPSLWFMIDSASTQARVGETVLLAMAILGDAGPTRTEPLILHRVLKALRYVGLRNEARAMALEAAVAAGL